MNARNPAKQKQAHRQPDATLGSKTVNRLVLVVVMMAFVPVPVIGPGSLSLAPPISLPVECLAFLRMINGGYVLVVAWYLGQGAAYFLLIWWIAGLANKKILARYSLESQRCILAGVVVSAIVLALLPVYGGGNVAGGSWKGNWIDLWKQLLPIIFSPA